MTEYSATFGFTHPMQPGHVPPSPAGVYSAEKPSRKMSTEFYSFDDQYLRRLVTGDPDTERHFVDYFSALLRAKLQLRLRSIQDVEDLRQEVFLRVLQALRNGPGLQHPGKLGAFVNAVCNNVFLEHIRSKTRTTQFSDDTPEPRETGGSLEAGILTEEVSKQLRVLLEDLPAKDRGLLRAVFLEERDKDAVCHDFGVHRDYLRVLLHRARRRLRDLLTRTETVAAHGRTSGGGRQ